MSLEILDQIASKKCATCMQSLQKFVRQQKLLHFKAELHFIDADAAALEDKFVWVIIKTPQSKKGLAHFMQGGKAYFVNPRNGAKADMSKYFMPPRIVRD